jgi:intracellular sulfur oxidation DsrE/DsrF family protein
VPRRPRSSFFGTKPSPSRSITRCGQSTRLVRPKRSMNPETKAVAVKNPYFEPKPGALRNDNIAIDKLLARGTVFGACSLALRAHARRLAKNAGVTAEEAAKEFTANVIPGITVIPSGVWGVNRARKAGCTYCTGG